MKLDANLVYKFSPRRSDAMSDAYGRHGLYLIAATLVSVVLFGAVAYWVRAG
jgi:hypothetical protein